MNRIAIIGGGPGGLTLALILQRHGIDSVIYERESAESIRDRGGSLDLHKDSGQLALKEAGLLEAFHKIARYEGEDLLLVDKHGTVYRKEVDETGKEGDRPEIDRGDLCELLLHALDPQRIRFGYKFIEAIPLADGKHELHFENGHVDTVDLVVGADGAFSKLRPLLTDASVEYSGLSMVELNIEDAANRHPDLFSFNGRGSMIALSDNKGILAQVNGDGRIRVYLSFRADRDWVDTNGIPLDKPQVAKQAFLKLFDDWDEMLKNYIRYAEDKMVTRRIYMLPIGLTWESRIGITLLGDAAHLMSPFMGEGVNLAMLDASVLALSLVQNGDLEESIRSYEQKMFEYSSPMAEMSDDNLKLFFADTGASGVRDWFDQFEQGHQEED
ncbi:tetracycline resistance protein [Paenibacillus pectinilyticus]|uniref:Flavin-dependent monooxygenase n=2 Tax=Paenibacillus pectinilyticus TaxID=512399 RepID=A0A1C0ZXB9_9BACL|nr:tetracycline resistance protein [Paenibacillus pectinilyticus]